jgi:tetratricopeptide (TPR) repeat protein
VQQILGLHEKEIANFYMGSRQAYKAAESRWRDIVANYPTFTYRDEALYKLGVALIEQEQPEEAAAFFSELVRDMPLSEYSGEAKKYLEKLGKPIPEPSAIGLKNGAPDRPGRMGRMKLILGVNDLEISKDGVLVSREGDAKDEEAAQLQKPIEAVGGVGAVRANSKTPVNNPQASGPATQAVPASASTEKSDAESKEAKPASPASKDDKKKKKKGGIAGIFK